MVAWPIRGVGRELAAAPGQGSRAPAPGAPALGGGLHAGPGRYNNQGRWPGVPWGQRGRANVPDVLGPVPGVDVMAKRS
jgi:hypothetical protein